MSVNHYTGLTFNTLKKELLQGRRLHDPDYAPQHITRIMQHCWNMLPERRPSFQDIFQSINRKYNISETLPENSHLSEVSHPKVFPTNH